MVDFVLVNTTILCMNAETKVLWDELCDLRKTLSAKQVREVDILLNEAIEELLIAQLQEMMKP